MPRRSLLTLALLMVLTLLSACGGGTESASFTATKALSTADTPVASTAAEAVATTTPAIPEGDRLRISAISVDAPIVAHVVGKDGNLGSPNGPDEVMLSDFRQNLPGYGGVPGMSNTILSGKMDSGKVACNNGSVPPPCKAVFWNLSALKKGDEIQVFWQGQQYDYTVVVGCWIATSDKGYESVVRSTDQEILTLDTAAGNFDATSRSYDDLFFVRAERKTNSIPSTCPAGTETPPFGIGDSGQISESVPGHAGSVAYRVNTSGFEIKQTLAQLPDYLTISPPLPGTDKIEVGNDPVGSGASSPGNSASGSSPTVPSLSLPATPGTFVIYFPASTPSGDYQLTLQLPDGRHASTTLHFTQP